MDSAWIGRSVVTDTAAPGPQGGYAERAVAEVGQLVAIPASLDMLDALALLHDGPTALTLVRNAGIAPGEYVLVTGAAGGLGLLLVQLAAAAGAHVIAAARGEQKLDLARKQGAAFAVDYSTSDWTDQVRKATRGGGLERNSRQASR